MANIPNVRFKGFTDDWEQRKLGEVCSEIGDGLHSAPAYDDNGEYYFINGNNLVNGKIIINLKEIKKVSEETFEKNNKHLDDSTVLLSINGTIGNLAYYAGEKVMLGKSAAYLKVKNIDKTFLYVSLQTSIIMDSFILSLTGTTIKNLGLEAIKSTRISIPNNKEQVQIGTYFAILDHLITLHQRKCDETKELKKYMLKKMFPQNGKKIPEIRFAGFTNVWEQHKVGNHCEMYNGDRSVKYPNASDMVEEGIPFINAGDIENGTINLKTCNKISREKYNDLGGAKLQMGDIVYCLRGTLGKNAIVDNFDEGTVASSLVAIRPKNINGKYLYYILNSDIEYRQRVVHNEGAAQPNLSAKSVSEFGMPVPSIEEQEKISVYFTALDNLINLHQRKYDELKEVKKFMLQNMFPQKG